MGPARQRAKLLAAICLTACPGPYEPACSAADLERLELAYQAELAQHCQGQGTNCQARGPIDAKYRAKRADWVRCSEEDQP